MVGMRRRRKFEPSLEGLPLEPRVALSTALASVVAHSNAPALVQFDMSVTNLTSHDVLIGHDGGQNIVKVKAGQTTEYKFTSRSHAASLVAGGSVDKATSRSVYATTMHVRVRSVRGHLAIST